MKNLILLRHGETTKDKLDPNRGLTNNGIKQIKLSAQIIKKTLRGSVVILTTNTKRSMQSAEILARETDNKFSITKLNLRINNIKEIKSSKFSNELSFEYLGLAKINKLPKSITKPEEIIKNFNKLIKNYEKYDNLIITGHSGGLETYIILNTLFEHKKLKKELKYGQIVKLKKK